MKSTTFENVQPNDRVYDNHWDDFGTIEESKERIENFFNLKA